MKNIMKLLSVLLCLVVAFSCFTACDKNTGKNNGAQGETPANSDSAESMTFGDEREVTMNGKTVTLPVISIKYGERTIHLPCTVKEFAEQSGCDFNFSTDLKRAIGPGVQSETSAFINNCIIRLEVRNDTSNDMAFEDCLIYSLELSGNSISNNYDNYWNDVEIPVGFPLSSDVTTEKVRDAFGKPLGVDDNSYGGLSLYYSKETELGASMYGFDFAEDGFLGSCTIGFALKEDLY